MNRFIGDRQVVLNLDGLRFIQKRNNNFSPNYHLDWEYKGGKGSASYETERERDEMYDQVFNALIEKKPNTPQPGVETTVFRVVSNLDG